MTTDKNSPALNITIWKTYQTCFGVCISLTQIILYEWWNCSSQTPNRASVGSFLKRTKTFWYQNVSPFTSKTKQYLGLCRTSHSLRPRVCKLDKVFQNHIIRFMTNHRLLEHIPIKELCKATKLIPITSIIKSKVLKLYGHIKRSQSSLSKIALEGMMEGKRSCGRQP